MIDLLHIINNPDYDTQYFLGTTGNTAAGSYQDYQTWKKPANCTWVYMLCVGGGASGATSLVGTAVGCYGGMGGATAQETTLIIPAMFLPDILYVQCGMGAIPNTYFSSTVGSLTMAGLPSYVSIEPSTVQSNNTIVIYSGGGPASLTVSNTTAGGTGPAATNSSIALMNLAGRGQFITIPNIIGAAGANGAASSTGGLIQVGGMGGAGIGGSGLTGAMAINPGPGLLLQQFGLGWDFVGQNPQVGAGSNGNNGAISSRFLMNFGGWGGASANSTQGSGIGGGGGAGSPGCGGGGCGASTSGTATPIPGTGGPGFVLIISF